MNDDDGDDGGYMVMAVVIRTFIYHRKERIMFHVSCASCNVTRAFVCVFLFLAAFNVFLEAAVAYSI